MYPEQHLTPLPEGHPCAACDVRLRTFCSALNAQELEQFRHEGAVIHAQQGDPLFHEGDPATVIYNLTKGMLKLYKLLPDGRRQVMGFVYPGDFLGITINNEHAFSAEAVEAIEACRFTRTRFEAFVENHPRMERQLYRMAAHELSIAQEQLLVLGRKTSSERMASFLLAMLNKEQETTADADTIRLPMNRLDIADYLGLTKETVSRVFTAFKTDHIIRLLSNNVVRVQHPHRLEAIASGFESVH